MHILLFNLRRLPRKTKPLPVCFCQVRNVNKKAKLKRYTASLNLPKTPFKDSMKDGVANAREKEILKTCSLSSLYNWQRNEQRKEFVLHDGPPYANGVPHVGHALNKILKDITNRFKLLQGYKVHYVPGWDCHGMPIEQKALSHYKKEAESLDPLELRGHAREFAKETVKKQSAAFERWGIMANWETHIYHTLDPSYIVNEYDVFMKMYEKNIIYEDFMPVHWSPSSGSALAEAEIEYNDNHVSTAVYVKFTMKTIPQALLEKLGSETSKVHLVTWTTTPWTLPCNKAVCYGEKISYSFVRDKKTDDTLILSSECSGSFAELSNSQYDVLFTITGSELSGSTYEHPVFSDQEQPLLPGHHIQLGKGTGLVHTAPAHGPEDFQVAVIHGLSMDCYVDEEGRYTSEVGERLTGKEVLSDGNEAVLQLLNDKILHREDFVHSYPYDWRTKRPIIFRASKQWFVNTEDIKDEALKILDGVEIFPKSSEGGMRSQIEARSYWCISRQRVWGVPIPVFYEKGSGKALLSQHSVNHIKSMVLKHGPDCWWKLPINELLPDDVISQSGFDPSMEFTKGTDVLDIWFDSGTSWATVLKDNSHQSDVYLEGFDQYGGWFLSSLLTSVAANKKSPYKSLIVHGFAVDDEGKKMSKSIGNVVDPNLVINGGKNKDFAPSYGADVLRWWSMQAGFGNKVTIGPKSLDSCNEEVFKIRKSLRYLLGNLYDFSIDDLVSVHELPLQDQYVLHLLYQFSKQVNEAYESYNYVKVTQLVEKFINTHVSRFYCHITKDRMYCEHGNSHARRSAQTVQYHLLCCLLKCMAPITPFMAEDVHRQHPFGGDPDSVFKTSWFEADKAWNQPNVANIMDAVLSIRDTFNSSIPSCEPEDFDVLIAAKWNLFKDIKTLQPDDMTSKNSGLTEVLGCSTCSILAKPPLVIPEEASVVEGKLLHTKPDGFQKERKYLLIVLPTEDFICERCRRYTSDKYGKPCDRCTDVLAVGWE